MDRIVNILMRRDGISREEAFEIVNECRELIDEVLNSDEYPSPYMQYEEIAQILQEELGLEPDYIDDFLF